GSRVGSRACNRRSSTEPLSMKPSRFFMRKCSGGETSRRSAMLSLSPRGRKNSSVSCVVNPLQDEADRRGRGARAPAVARLQDGGNLCGRHPPLADFHQRAGDCPDQILEEAVGADPIGPHLLVFLLDPGDRDDPPRVLETTLGTAKGGKVALSEKAGG